MLCWYKNIFIQNKIRLIFVFIFIYLISCKPSFIWFKCFFTFSFLTSDARERIIISLLCPAIIIHRNIIFFFFTDDDFHCFICFSSLQIEPYDSIVAFVTLFFIIIIVVVCFYFWKTLFVLYCIDFRRWAVCEYEEEKNDATPLKLSGRSGWMVTHNTKMSKRKVNIT